MHSTDRGAEESYEPPSFGFNNKPEIYWMRPTERMVLGASVTLFDPSTPLLRCDYLQLIKLSSLNCKAKRIR